MNTEKLADASLISILSAFIMGLRFDLVISGYLLTFPFLILTILYFFKSTNELILRILKYFVLTVFIFAFAVTATDIPYFNQFFSRLTIDVFEWLNSPMFIVEMVLSEPRYFIYFLPLLTLIYFYVKHINKIFSKIENPVIVFKTYTYASLASVFFLLLMFIGIRGRTAQKSPIRVGTAYFSDSQFLNKLGLNPNFTLIRSYLNAKKNKDLNLLDPKLALANSQGYLGLKTLNQKYPLAREVKGDSLQVMKPNIVLVLMESMSAKHMEQFGGQANLTPFLDSLANHSYNFKNIYSAGTHTFNGVFSTLFSYPAIFAKHPMKLVDIKQFNGLSYNLKKHNYSTHYFTTHDGQFDNIEGFLKANYFDHVYTDANYPSDKSLSNLGVPDDFLFNFSLDVFKKESNPFLAVYLTGSNHGPYNIPSYYKARTNDAKSQVVEYADWSLKQFMANAKKQTWFKNTLFVFVADHGVSMNEIYSMPLSYNHIPLLIYSPLFDSIPRQLNQLGSQIDVFPSIMGLTNLPYLNNSFGIDLLKENPRPFTYFVADRQLAVMNDSLLYIENRNQKSLFPYRKSQTKSILTKHSELAEQMSVYAKSQMQAADFLIKKNLQFVSDNE